MRRSDLLTAVWTTSNSPWTPKPEEFTSKRFSVRMIADVPLIRLGVISQINGGILQGISYALFEQRIMDRSGGYMLNANLENYKILGAREVPEIEVELGRE